MNSNNLKYFLIVICFLKFGNLAKIDNDGGYSIILAIDSDSTPEPDDVSNFLFSVQSKLSLFSQELFAATDNHFYIKNTDLLVPSSWQLSTGESTSQSYAEADIRLSSSISAPYVENANPCGLPGSYIELPFRFLDDSSEPFGPQAKALVNQWARYRWGVWDEHGEPGSNETFPYFYKNPDVADSAWEATSCSDVKLGGEFTDINGEICDVTREGRPNANCRFRPSPTNMATSSLMSFHWMESVTKFCNKLTHNRVAPNRQNHYCDYQSVWDVIKQTADYAKVTDKNSTIPPFELKIVKSRTHPALYVLLDRGDPTGNSNGHRIVTAFLRKLVPFFEQKDLENTVVGVGTFPGEKSGQNLQKLISWLRVGDHRDEILKAIGSGLIGPAYRNFGAGIEEAAIEISKTHPEGGAVLLILKTGSSDRSFGYLPYEQDVLSLLLRNRVAVFALELLNPGSPVNLNNIVVKTGGHHLQLTSIDSTESDLDQFLVNVRNSLSNPILDNVDTLIHKGRIPQDTSVTVPLPSSGISNVRIHLTLPAAFSPTIKIDGRISIALYSNEWGETTDISRRRTHTVSIVPERETLVIEFTCDTCISMTGNLVVSARKTVKDDDIHVTLRTSAMENAVDFANLHSNIVPFAIYAQIDQNGKPVRDLTVQAQVSIKDGESVAVDLIDNGIGNPDLYRNDGIYSSIFIPSSNGPYSISVKVENKISSSVKHFSENEGDKISPRLLPVDQIGLPERESVKLDKPYLHVEDYPSQVMFSNVDSYIEKNKPSKIMDLFAIVDDTANNKIKMTFTSPKLIWGVGKATSYEIRGAKLIDALINENGIEDLGTITEVGDPDTLETIFVQNPPAPDDLHYFQIRAKNGDNAVNAQNSIIVHARAAEEEESTESTTVSTSTPDPVSTVDPSTAGPTTTDPPTAGPTTTDPTTAGPTTTDAPTTNTPEDSSTVKLNPPVEPDTPFFETAAGIVVIILIVLIILGAAGGGYWWYKKKQLNSYNRQSNDDV